MFGGRCPRCGDEDIEIEEENHFGGVIEYVVCYECGLNISVEDLREKLVKIGRNDPCPCGSGKKYKKCCLKKNYHSKRVYSE